MKLITTLIALPLAASAMAQGDPPQALFVQLSASLSEDMSLRQEVQAFRPIAVRSDLLLESAEQGSGRFELETFGGQRLVTTFESSESTRSGGLVWTGRIEGSAWSIVNFSIQGDALAGSIRFDHTLLRIDPDPTLPGVQALTWLDEQRFKPCGVGPEHHVGGPRAHANAATEDGPGAGLIADVLVAYSPQARAAQGGTNGILALINLAIAETNQAYGNSQIDLRLRLAGTHETNQSETSDMGQVLSRVRSTSDGWYDEVHPIRTQVGADFVAMIVSGGQYCGIGYLMTSVSPNFRTSAFTVTSRTCATGYYSFGHEIGHNMGCHHDRQNASSGAFPYSYGYRTPNSAYRTVMAYSPGTRIQYFSSPNVTFAGYSLGVAHPASNSADNARGIDDAAPVTSAWYCAMPEAFGTGTLTSQWFNLTLGHSGIPNSNGSGNFSIDVSNGVPGQLGLAFYSQATNNAPFYGGTLYVGSPLVRMAPQLISAAGTASFDWISHAQPSVGETYFIQFWQRDPAGTPLGNTVAISNGLRVEICN